MTMLFFYRQHTGRRHRGAMAPRPLGGGKRKRRAFAISKVDENEIITEIDFRDLSLDFIREKAKRKRAKRRKMLFVISKLFEDGVL